MPDNASILHGTAQQGDLDSLGRLAGRELNLTFNGIQRHHREDDVAHLGNDHDIVTKAVLVARVAVVGGFNLVNEPRLDDRDVLRAGRNVRNFKPPFAIGQYAGRSVAIDPDQGARQRIAGSAIADEAVDGGEGAEVGGTRIRSALIRSALIRSALIRGLLALLRVLRKRKRAGGKGQNAGEQQLSRFRSQPPARRRGNFGEALSFVFKCWRGVHSQF